MKSCYLILWFWLAGCGAMEPKPQVIDPDLLGYYEEFKEDCAKSFRAEVCEARLPYVSTVQFKNLMPEALGMAHFRSGINEFEVVIEIDPTTPDVRLTMYHELGHAIGIDHLPNSCIMDTHLQNVEDWGGWDKCKYVFFYVQ